MPTNVIHLPAARTAIAISEKLTPLQLNHLAARARANKVCRNEPGVVSKYELGEMIAEFELAQITHSELGHLAEAITYNSVIAKLKTLIPV